MTRRLEAGIDREFSLTRHLSMHDFPQVSRPHGDIHYFPKLPDFSESGDAEKSHLLFLIEGYRRNSGSLWYRSVGVLARMIDRLSARLFIPDLHRAVDREMHPHTVLVGKIGSVLARMHARLSCDREGPFSPAPIALSGMEHWVQGVRGLFERLHINPPLEIFPVLDDEDEIMKTLSRLCHFGERMGCRIQVHGDFHLGQILLSGKSFYFLDFEGEPLRSHAERISRRSPLVDLAAFLRSLDYAGTVALEEYWEHHAPDATKLGRAGKWVAAWIDRASETFLSAYLAGMENEGCSHLLPQEKGLFEALLEGLKLERALYETVYELTTRPDWVKIPVHGVMTCHERLVARLEKLENDKVE